MMIDVTTVLIPIEMMSHESSLNKTVRLTTILAELPGDAKNLSGGTFHTQCFLRILKTFPHLHVVARRTEPFEQEDGKCRHVDRHNQHQDPRRSVKRFCVRQK